MVDLRPVDVYQLHRYGGNSEFGRESGLNWLKNKLALKGYRRPVIIVQHFEFSLNSFSIPDSNSKDTDTTWSVARRDILLEVLLPYNVIALLVGHLHNPAVAIPNDKIQLPNAQGTLPHSFNKAPIREFRPGAALNTMMALFRVEAAEGANIVKTNALFGRGNAKDPSVIDWDLGCSFEIPFPNPLYV